MNARSLMAILACAVAVPAVAGPRWAAGAVKEVRVLGDDLEVVRILGDRAELDAFAAWFHRAREVEAAPPGRPGRTSSTSTPPAAAAGSTTPRRASSRCSP